ncbi:SPX domain-containing protein 1-like [Aristolochia californica]|uniref:SPX domain-containing protein 1-like n=1 Tax=Aristolochia californica TaxID=171875 RepID=UPI0035DBCE0B
MKFGKRLSNQIEETLPEWRDKFLSYKDLKKLLKQIVPKGGDRRKRPRLADSSENETGDAAITKEEMDFIRLLEAELEKFNAFFVEKEEEYIIRQKELQDRVAKTKDFNEDQMKMKIRKEIVDFHGEMVLLENYSALNYTGLVKILKKYDKRTGALIRLPFIRKVMQQPFFTTDLLNKLVKECETMLDTLFPSCEPSVSGSLDEVSDPRSPAQKERSLRGQKDLGEIEYMESLYMKSTMSALRSLKEIRSGSSTVSVFSLPPLQSNGVGEIWSKVPVLEQVAK